MNKKNFEMIQKLGEMITGLVEEEMMTNNEEYLHQMVNIHKTFQDFFAYDNLEDFIEEVEETKVEEIKTEKKISIKEALDRLVKADYSPVHYQHFYFNSILKETDKPIDDNDRSF